jgi:subtilisin family serine protease
LIDKFQPILREADAEEIENFRLGEAQVIAYFLHNYDHSVAEVVEALEPLGGPEVAFERDAELRVLAAPDDPDFAQQWAWQKLEAEPAWARFNAAAPNAPVTIGIVDWGVQIDHEDLDQTPGHIVGHRVIRPAGGSFADDNGHGTMLAGTIAAVTNNSLGVAGAMPVAKLIAVKFIDSRTPPTALYAAKAIWYAVSQGAKIVNMSWDVGTNRAVLRAAIFNNPNVLFVAAAGNGGTDNTEYPTFPAVYAAPNVIAVMASDEADEKPGFSCYGDNVDIAAPGVRIMSTSRYLLPPTVPPPRIYNPAYRFYSGTSASAAHITGAAALLLSIDNWTPGDLREHLVASADRIRDLRRMCRAEGRLNLRRAVVGPFAIEAPRGGEHLVRNTQYRVRWRLEYDSPVVNTVELSLRNAITGATTVLAGPLPANSGQATVTWPNNPVAKAFIRIRCLEKSLYTDSGIFRII